MRDAVNKTFSLLADALAPALDDWWVIGSAAVAMHGGSVGHLKDIDVLMSARDAKAFCTRVGAMIGEPEESALFRSSIFGVWNSIPVPVEIFGGFKLAQDGAWREVTLKSRESVYVEATKLYVPSRADLIAMLHTFGRPKDLERARLLES